MPYQVETQKKRLNFGKSEKPNTEFDPEQIYKTGVNKQRPNIGQMKSQSPDKQKFGGFDPTMLYKTEVNNSKPKVSG